MESNYGANWILQPRFSLYTDEGSVCPLQSGLSGHSGATIFVFIANCKEKGF
ncbi:hypothetical protein [Pedobacter miscanthi]|uniref:hypothetical protein n=1 Tax=Pedobacter miscanthi TaxID=2259170 RepID=UPI00131454FD|nr:hypothetical protein [Pedobacter miscanthi]